MFKDQASSSNEAFRQARLFDITEYGRAVHAEMEALLACARTGRSTVGATLFVTTFPCHNCAKHIIAAGIRQVVYVEPYPKSQAEHLYPDSIAMDDGEAEGEPYDHQRVRFTPFVGIGPRRYVDLFSMKLGSGYPLVRKTRGVKAPWQLASAQPRIPLPSVSYLQREYQVSKWVLEKAPQPPLDEHSND